MRLIFLSLFFMLFNVYFAETNADKLEEIKRELDKTKLHLKQTEKEKKKALSSYKKIKKKLSQNQKDINWLKYRENKINKRISSTLNEINELSDKEDLFGRICVSKLNEYLELENYNLAYKHENEDLSIIRQLITLSTNAFENAKNIKQSKLKEKEKYEKTYKEVTSRKQSEIKKKNKYETKIHNLNKTISQKEKEKKEYLALVKRLEEEAETLENLLKRLNLVKIERDYDYKFSSDKLNWPIQGKLVRKFGEQTSSYKTKLINSGIDIESTSKQNVLAVDDGVVAYAKYQKGIGKIVVIDHNNGFVTTYSHNSKLLVVQGDRVKKDEPIAILEPQGNHNYIHFEIRKDGKPVNPIKYLK